MRGIVKMMYIYSRVILIFREAQSNVIDFHVVKKWRSPSFLKLKYVEIKEIKVFAFRRLSKAKC